MREDQERLPKTAVSAAGKFAPATGASDCTACSQGQYDDREARSSCGYSCPAGKFSGTGSTSCAACGAGKYSAVGQATCTYCVAGKFRPSGSSHTLGCSNCASGEYASLGSSECTAHHVTTCGKGQQLSTVPSSAMDGACTACPGGRFQPADASSATSCTAVTPCQKSEYEIAVPTATSDRRCSSLSSHFDSNNLAAVCAHTTCSIEDGRTVVHDWHAHQVGFYHHCVSHLQLNRCVCVCSPMFTRSTVVHDVASHTALGKKTLSVPLQFGSR